MLPEIELDRGLRLGISALGFEQATEVQERVIPTALAGKDLLITAETGSGKTLAYLVPTLQRILGAGPDRSAGALAVVLVPTRELARQVLKNCRDLCQKTPLRAQAITGGADFKYQRALLRKNPEIIIATPGRLLEHCEKGSADLESVQTLVLDEADRMLDMGFRDDVAAVAGFCKAPHQVILLSATLQHRGLSAMARELLQEPVTVTLNPVRQPHSSIHHQRILADSGEHKDKLLLALMQKGGYRRVLVFANKRSTAQRLAGLLSHHDLRSGALHGDLTTEERKHVLAQLRDNKLDIVCASDVAARGLDVKDIDLVVNYDVPRSGDDYLHRTGRTGRAGASGLAITLVSASEWNLMVSIQRYLKTGFEARALPGLKARYSGPKKQKSSGKAAGSKKRRKPAGDKSKSRARNKKNQGKPSRKGPPTLTGDGFAPLMKKKPKDD
ncbi:DEAD/DEAH box helicase [Pseudohalioglobus sediminis]|uniref:DEAD/DEAH box helicase n=1 Tax=Pseudohalioglobus sediminis TaxID=2606449 RepID=A0A5B0X3H2_9GAMM|nr:DEAD/DEAH box helicase [Pseudohalioglobus sediminis]KAA1192841.1 DEAD/DEAH box helicase [Pseudohalioglobus sediminis]